MIFRGKFRQALQKTALCTRIPAKVWKQDWVVHCKPVGDGRTVLKYLAPYIFRVAISNHRLVKLEHDQVTFRYRTTDTVQLRLCTLSAEEFIHRFLQHALPKGFVKVRYYGFFVPGYRLHLAALRQQLQNAFQDCDESGDAEQGQELAASALAPILRCPRCGQAMRLKHTIQPTGRCPP